MITCKVCRRVATGSATYGWCYGCHTAAEPPFHEATTPLPVSAQVAFISKYMRSMATRIEKGATTQYCECHTTDSPYTNGSQCRSYGTYVYEGRRVCAPHLGALKRGSSFRFVGSPDPKVDRVQAYKLLSAAFEEAPDDALRSALAKVMLDARNSESQGAGSEAEAPGAGAGGDSDGQGDLFSWAAARCGSPQDR